MPAVRRGRREVSGDQAGPATDVGSAQATPRKRRLRAGFRTTAESLKTPAGLAIGLATLLGLALRLYLVTRPGYLTSGNVEYDDGVYLGAAMRLLHGAMPYRDYAFVQPPGILIFALPGAVTGALTSQVTGFAVMRILSVLASTACIPLAGRLVRHRGAIACVTAAGILAVYPADILSSRTLLLEPWMNLAVLLAASAAFRDGQLKSPRWLAWAGVALGVGVTIKLWAGVPAAVLLALCLILRPSEEERQARVTRARRAGALVGGAAGGFAVFAGPFALADPTGFIQQSLFDQFSRQGTPPSASLRLAHITGLIDVLGLNGRIALPGTTTHTMFAMGAEAGTADVTAGWYAYAAALIGIVFIAAGYLCGLRQRTPLEWFALATAVLATAAILYSSEFFYHYPDFSAPWIAIAVGAAAQSLACLIKGSGKPARTARRVAAGAVAVAVLAVAVVEARELEPVRASANPASAAALIPKGSCVVADQISYLIATNRFSAPSATCPDVIDGLAATLSLSGGVSPQGGAGDSAKVVADWEAMFAKAQYAWISNNVSTRLPWTGALEAWFNAHFRVIATYSGYGETTLYARR